MISIRNVSMQYPVPKRYREYLFHPFGPRKKYPALSNVSLQIEKGSKIALLGANGAGKTTLLKLVGGLLYPAEGEIWVNGYNTATHNVEARRSVGFVLNEERSFYWRLTGFQNLEFFGALDNLRGKILTEKIRRLIRLVDLEEAAHRIVAGYSSGMKQRLAIARGLLSDPEILILDEPTRALDPVAAEEIKALIINRVHQQENRTLLIATHRFDEAEELCDQVCVMAKGHVLDHCDIGDTRLGHNSLFQFYTHTISRKTPIIQC